MTDTFDTHDGETEEVADDTLTPATHPTNFSGDLGDIAGVVAERTADENDDEPTGSIVESALISETGEVAHLAAPLNNRDIIDPNADNRHPNPVPRKPAHVFADDSPDKPDDYVEPGPHGLQIIEDQGDGRVEVVGADNDTNAVRDDELDGRQPAGLL